MPKIAKLNSKQFRSSLWRVLREAVPSRWKLLTMSFICIIGVASFTAALAYSTRLIVNDVFVSNDATAAYQVAALVVVVAFLKSAFTYANSIISVVYTRSVSAAYQKKVYGDILNKDLWHFMGEHSAGQMARIKLFGSSTGAVVVSVSNKFPTELLILLGLLTVMFLQDPLMTLACSIIFPLIFWLVAYLGRRVRKIAAAQAELEAAYFAVGAESFEGIKTVKTYGLEGKIVENFNGSIDTLEKRILSIAKVTSATVPLMEFIGGMVLGVFVVYAAWQTITNGKTPGEFTAFITAFLMAYQPAEKLTKIWVNVQKSLVHVNTMYGVLDAPPKLKLSGSQTLPKNQNGIEFEDVSFGYTATKKAILDVNLSIKPGEKVALVGRSGAGKSTIVDLLLRFFDPTEGRITIGGSDLASVSPTSIYQSIALISQDVFLFDGTIRDNIKDGNPDASALDIEDAARKAALVDVLGNLPDGLDTKVGANGKALSGGQKQRVGIARALAKNAEIYIFDEATSALDGDNERAIMQNLISSLDGKTIVFVTHRGSTLPYVDRVIVLEEGKLIGFDTVEALQKEHPNFRSLFNLDPVPSVKTG